MAERGRKIVVEVLIPGPVEQVWERSQTPESHVLWDIRFDSIEYLDEKDARGFHRMLYQTRIGFGLKVKGYGHYLHSVPGRLSTFEFDSTDWKSLITRGRGIWQYEPMGSGIRFRTVYDYESRYSFVGQLIDWLIFRRVLRLATEWSFETLRLWCNGDRTILSKRRARWRFLRFFLARYLGPQRSSQAARSWLGSGP